MPGISIFFDPFGERGNVVISPFIRPIHPKSEIRSDLASIQRILKLGWVAQMKVHGHRAQIHVPANSKEPLLVFTRQGKFHTVPFPQEMEREVRRIFAPKSHCNVIDTEWYKPEDKLFVFDLLKRDGELLDQMTFPDRWKLLPREFLSPSIAIVPILKDEKKCLQVLQDPKPWVEGLVFRSSSTPGFEDTSIVRCRKKENR